MTTRNRILIVTFFCVAILLAAATAFSAVGDNCYTADGLFYNKVSTTSVCKKLCDPISDAGNELSCGPIYFSDQHGATDFICRIAKAQTNCITPADIVIWESESSATAIPTVWSKVCTLTGVIDPLVQSCRFGRPPLGAVMSTQSASADADCTDVEVVCTLIRPLATRPTP